MDLAQLSLNVRLALVGGSLSSEAPLAQVFPLLSQPAVTLQSFIPEGASDEGDALQQAASRFRERVAEGVAGEPSEAAAIDEAFRRWVDGDPGPLVEMMITGGLEVARRTTQTGVVPEEAERHFASEVFRAVADSVVLKINYEVSLTPAEFLEMEPAELIRRLEHGPHHNTSDDIKKLQSLDLKEVPKPLVPLLQKKAREIQSYYIEQVLKTRYPEMNTELGWFYMEPTVETLSQALASLELPCRADVLPEGKDVKPADVVEHLVKTTGTTGPTLKLFYQPGALPTGKEAEQDGGPTFMPQVVVALIVAGPLTVKLGLDRKDVELEVSLTNREGGQRDSYPHSELAQDILGRSRIMQSSHVSFFRDGDALRTALLRLVFSIPSYQAQVFPTAVSRLSSVTSASHSQEAKEMAIGILAANILGPEGDGPYRQETIDDFVQRIFQDEAIAGLMGACGLEETAQRLQVAVRLSRLPATRREFLERITLASHEFDEAIKGWESIRKAAGFDDLDIKAEKKRYLLYCIDPLHPANPYRLKGQRGYSWMVEMQAIQRQAFEKLWDALAYDHGLLAYYAKGEQQHSNPFAFIVPYEIERGSVAIALTDRSKVARLASPMGGGPQDLHLVLCDSVGSRPRLELDVAAFVAQTDRLYQEMVEMVRSQIIVEMALGEEAIAKAKELGVPFRLTPLAYAHLRQEVGKTIRSIGRALNAYHPDPELERRLQILGFAPPKRRDTVSHFDSWGGVVRGSMTLRSMPSTTLMDEQLRETAQVDLAKLLEFCDWLDGHSVYGRIVLADDTETTLTEHIREVARIVSVAAAGQVTSREAEEQVEEVQGTTSHLTTSTYTSVFAHNGWTESVYRDTQTLFATGESVLCVGADGKVFWSSNLRMRYGSGMTAAHSALAPSTLELASRPAPWFASMTTVRRTTLGEAHARVKEEDGALLLAFGVN